jgi:hypothetical protein
VGLKTLVSLSLMHVSEMKFSIGEVEAGRALRIFSCWWIVWRTAWIAYFRLVLGQRKFSRLMMAVIFV